MLWSKRGRPVRVGLRDYFSEREPAQPDQLAMNLWTQDVGLDQYGGSAEAYQAALLDQYKTYVEMADRISARRGLTNTFFLTLNSGVLVLIGVILRDAPPATSVWVALFPSLALLVQCGAWFSILRSYRQLNGGKWAVVGALEQRLPASPYWCAEWVALGQGKDRRRYWPLTHVEQWVPLVFAVLYLAGFVTLLIVG